MMKWMRWIAEVGVGAPRRIPPRDASEPPKPLAAGLRDMEKTLRESLSVQRANVFVVSLPGSKGAHIESSDIPVEDDNGFTDLISLLLHAESPEARFRLEVGRVQHEEQPPRINVLDGCSVENFSIIKK